MLKLMGKKIFTIFKLKIFVYLNLWSYNMLHISGTPYPTHQLHVAPNSIINPSKPNETTVLFMCHIDNIV